MSFGDKAKTAASFIWKKPLKVAALWLGKAAAIVVIVIVIIVLLLGVGVILFVTFQAQQQSAGLDCAGNTTPSGIPTKRGGGEDHMLAKLGLQIAQQRGASQLVIMAMFEAGEVESTWQNLPNGDADSAGIFQMRPSVKVWGTYEQVTDPVYAVNKFLDKAIESEKKLGPGTSPGKLAQDVERSAFPNRYDEAGTAAGALLRAVGGEPAVQGINLGTAGCGSNTDAKFAIGGNTGELRKYGNRGDSVGSFNLPGGERAVALRFAIQQLGKPYVWGGNGPDNYDCSGLVIAAYKAAGVTIPPSERNTSAMWNGMTQRGQTFHDRSQLLPGDLIFYGSPGVDHVSMYMGPNKVIQAPQPGDFVDIVNYYGDKASETQKIVGFAHIVPPPPANPEATNNGFGQPNVGAGAK